MWAPEIHFVDNRYIVYFTARQKITCKLCVGAAVSHSPVGPYKDIGKPLVDNNDPIIGVIDGHHFYDRDGTPYLLWKTDDNAVSQDSKIYIREINRDGLSFDNSTVTTKLLTASYDWEKDIVEGPWLIHRNNFYYLFYSTFYYSYDIGYGVGVARSKDLLGPYDKFHKLILHTDFDTYANGENTTFISPGHCSVVEVRYIRRI